jgi:hypothetical protein
VANFIDQLEALLREATPGPWYLLETPWLPSDCDTTMLAGSPDPHAGTFICDFDNFAATEDDDKNNRAWEDAELLRFLRNHADALLEVVKAAHTHVWTPQRIDPPEAQQTFMALRQALRKLGVGE